MNLKRLVEGFCYNTIYQDICLNIFFSGASARRRKWWKRRKKERASLIARRLRCRVKSNVVSAGGEVLQGSSWSNAWHNTAEKGVSAKK